MPHQSANVDFVARGGKSEVNTSNSLAAMLIGPNRATYPSGCDYAAGIALDTQALK